MARRRRSISPRVVGLVVVALGLLLFGGLFLVGQQQAFWVRTTEVVTDFRTITGLRRDSTVQLAGVRIGSVQAIDFVTRRYVCDPMTEDFGRHGERRSNDCDAMLFCATNGLCASLEGYVAKAMHRPCLDDGDCASDEVCVTTEFRRRARRVAWRGPDGVCARYNTDHKRVQVTMRVREDSLATIGSDSRATVVSSGVLGDQMINITAGGRDPLPADHRIQSTASMSESLGQFRENFVELSDKVESGLSGISSTFAELNDENTILSVKQTLGKLEVNTTEIAAGRGSVGAFIGDPAYEDEFVATLRKARDTATFVDGVVADASRGLAKVDRDIGPDVDALRGKVADVRGKLAPLEVPADGAAPTLLHDPDGRLTAEFEHSLTNVRNAAAAVAIVADRVAKGEGTLGALIYDEKVHHDLHLALVDVGKDWKVGLLVWLARRVGPESPKSR
ncbi:MAG: hypothetical protein IPK74_21435 [Deltaproteobacteria bacterium]|nr:hypothetical protein [Deltaproteobacteria bacterium]